MIDIAKYFLILFTATFINREMLKQFAETHINRLTANNPGGIYSTILANITTAYNLFFGDEASEALLLSVQKGLTLGMNTSRLALLHFIQQKEGAIKSKYGKGSLEYLQAFPHGLEAFGAASLIEFKTLAQNFLAFLVVHAAALEPGLVATCTTLLNTFEANRTAQLTQIGTVTGMHIDAGEAKDDLCKGLTYNLLTVARDNLGHPENISKYFDTSIIAEGVDPALRGKIQVNATDNIIGAELTVSSEFLCRNNANVRIFFSRSVNAYTKGPVGQWVEPGAEVAGGTAEFGVGQFFNGTTESVTETAAFSVTQTA